MDYTKKNFYNAGDEIVRCENCVWSHHSEEFEDGIFTCFCEENRFDPEFVSEGMFCPWGELNVVERAKKIKEFVK